MFYSSFRDAYDALKTTGHALDYMDALLKFAFDGKTTRTGDAVTDAFISAFEPQIEANKKRRKNGKKGGRPVKEKTNGLQEVKTNGFETGKPNVNVNENVNVNVNENANDNVSELDLFVSKINNPQYKKSG